MSAKLHVQLISYTLQNGPNRFVRSQNDFSVLILELLPHSSRNGLPECEKLSLFAKQNDHDRFVGPQAVTSNFINVATFFTKKNPLRREEGDYLGTFTHSYLPDN